MASTAPSTNVGYNAGGSGGSGSIVLRGNQLVWLPTSSGATKHTQPQNVVIKSANSLVQVLKSPFGANAPTPGGRVYLNQPGSAPNPVLNVGQQVTGRAKSPVRIQVVSSNGVKGQFGENHGQNTRLCWKIKNSRPISDHNIPTSSSSSISAFDRFTGTMPASFPSFHRQASFGPSRIFLRGHGGMSTTNSMEQRVTDQFSAGSGHTLDEQKAHASQLSTAQPLRDYMRTLQPVQSNFSNSIEADQTVIKKVDWNSGVNESTESMVKFENMQIQHDHPQQNLPLLYFSQDDTYLEEDVGGLTVGANSSQAMTLNELPPLSLKKNAFLKGLRKPCNCTRSMCLKLYCECFANGEFCKNCNCTNCKNVMTSENDRSRAIKSCLERNPLAFQPKIGKGRADTDRLHNKGCNCKRSSCLKNYCECYEAKVACTSKCKCVSCRNTESDRNQPRIRRQSAFSHSLAFGRPSNSIASGLYNFTTLPSSEQRRSNSDQFFYDSVGPCNQFYEDGMLDPKKMPWYYMNDDVVQATALCLVAQAEQVEGQVQEEGDFYNQCNVQRAVLQEFGACLQQIIQLTS